MAYCRLSNSDFYIYDDTSNQIVVYAILPDSIPSKKANEIKRAYSYEEIPLLIDLLKEYESYGASIPSNVYDFLMEDYYKYTRETNSLC